MAIDTPATIAILGAGPIGLETALYARFLGYEVKVYERGEIAANVRAWGHVKLFSPFAMNRSPLGLAALQAQSPGWQAPDDDELLTGQQYAQQYLLPLSETDLLADCIQQHTQVVAVSRAGPTKTDLVGDASRAEIPFRLLLRDRGGTEATAQADSVIDTTGTYGNHRWVGQGGIPAAGEHAASADIAYHLPDILNAERENYAGKHTLLVGAGYSAATCALAMNELTASTPGTKVTWITRHADTDNSGPIPVIVNDRLPERDRVARSANAIAAADHDAIRHLSGTVIERIESVEGGRGLEVYLTGKHQEKGHVDRIIASVGYRPDSSLYDELQVHQCYATEGPMKLASTLVQQTSADCLDQTAAGPDALRTTEPDFYILGSKSYGRDSKFLISIGLKQIQQLFTIIGDRADLDLYCGVHHLIA